MDAQRRMPEIDVLRGILIVTVVVGHAIQQYAAALGRPGAAVESFIYSFHMPVFVFVSGFCASRMTRISGWDEEREFLMSRFSRLLVPYFVWGGIYFVLRLCFGGYARIPYDYSKVAFFLGGYNPDGAMWFVWALFAATALVVLAVRRVSVPCLLGLSLLAFGILYYSCDWTADYLRAILILPMYAFFILLGVLFRNRFAGAGVSTPLSRIPLLFCGCCFALAYGLQTSKISSLFPWHLLTSVSAAFLLHGLACGIANRCAFLKSSLALLGVEAMAIYVLGEPIKVGCRIALSKLGVPVAIAFPVMIVCMFVLPVLLSRVIRRSAVLRRLLLGESVT